MSMIYLDIERVDVVDVLALDLPAVVVHVQEVQQVVAVLVEAGPQDKDLEQVPIVNLIIFLL